MPLSPCLENDARSLRGRGDHNFPTPDRPFLKPQDRVCMLDANKPIAGLAPQRELLPTEKGLQAWI